jgi:hypothetical protein
MAHPTTSAATPRSIVVALNYPQIPGTQEVVPDDFATLFLMILRRFARFLPDDFATLFL